MDAVLDLIYDDPTDQWPDDARDAFTHLFGSGGGRYRKHAQNKVKVRAPGIGSSVPFAALIHPSNPDSGAYGGMSFVVFPQPDTDAPALFGLVLGTQGLSPDEQILAKPGHARKARAICKWLNRKYGKSETIAWAKQDPVRLDQEVPKTVQQKFSDYGPVFDKYGGELYAIYQPGPNREATDQALKAMLDLIFAERGEQPLSNPQQEAEEIRREYYQHLLPAVDQRDVADLLSSRRYAILQGPPGTGKTRLALQLLEDHYDGRGRSIQFHPNTTYEDFIGGLAPVEASAGMGFKFEPTKGALMRAAEEARNNPEASYLLHIDEINRADLPSVLGEAVFLLEQRRETQTGIELAHDFGPPFGNELELPPNLHILGTMNTSDRSIAILDVAIRRRFAFQELWPQLDVVREHGCELMIEKFREILQIFVEHASDDAFKLLPGHSYFLEEDQQKAPRALQTRLKPLLTEYLNQGYVAGFEEEIRSYVQSIETL